MIAWGPMLLLPLISMGVCVGEYFLAKRSWALGLILPVLSAAGAIFYLGFLALTLVLLAILLIVFFVQRDKKRELNRMKSQDLE